MPFFRYKECDIFFEDRGVGECALYVHEWSTSSFSFRKYNMSYLTGSARVVCVDLPGYGESGFPMNLDFRDFSPLLVTLLDHLGVEKCTLIGFCMGSAIALDFYRNHPHRVTGLFLVEPMVKFPEILLPLLIPGFGPWFLRRLGKSRALFSLVGTRIIGKEQMVREAIFKGIGKADPRVSYRYLWLLFLEYHRKMEKIPPLSPGQRIYCISGEDSNSLFRKNLAYISRIIQITEHITIEDSHHYVIAEEPRKIADIILEKIQC